MIKIKRDLLRIILLSAALSALLFNPANLEAATNKDVILVLDTSLSMVGSGGKDIFEDVKKSINIYIDGLQDGDRVTFITFDEDVKVYPQVILDDKNDRDIIKKYISMTEAHGMWTHTLNMLQNVFAIADKLTNEKTGEIKRNLVIVIMSDGLDDPPPARIKDKFTLKTIADQYSGNDWWIYMVNLADMQKSPEIASALEKMREDLKIVSDNTMIIDSLDPNSTLNVDIKKNIERKEFIQKKVLPFVAIVLAIITLIAVFVYLRVKKLKVKGVLEYWNHELLKPEVHRFDLTPLSTREIIVGRILGCNVKIRDFESRHSFSLKAQSKKGAVVLQLLHAEELEVGFKNKEFDGFVNNGDIFTASNYSFRYLSE